MRESIYTYVVAFVREEEDIAVVLHCHDRIVLKESQASQTVFSRHQEPLALLAFNLCALAQLLEMPASTVLAALSTDDARLLAWLTELRSAVWTLSDQISQQYFVHVHARDTSLGG